MSITRTTHNQKNDNQVPEMADKAVKLLLIEDNPDDAELLRRKLVSSSRVGSSG